MTDKIEQNTLVSVHYTGTFTDGEVFDSSEGRDPLTFLVGHGQMITGFEQEMLGAEVGEKRDFTLTPDRAYGMRTDEAIQEVPLEERRVTEERVRETHAEEMRVERLEGEEVPSEGSEGGNDDVNKERISEKNQFLSPMLFAPGQKSRGRPKKAAGGPPVFNKPTNQSKKRERSLQASSKTSCFYRGYPNCNSVFYITC